MGYAWISIKARRKAIHEKAIGPAADSRYERYHADGLRRKRNRIHHRGNSVCRRAAPQKAGAGGEEEVAYKDTLVLVTATDQNYMDGQMNNTNDKILRMAYSSLVRKDPVTNETVGDLAESWEVSDDGLTWTFHLRKGVKFHNGKELTATDVKASYDRLLNEDDPVRYTSTMNLIKSCEIVDDYTVTLSTEEPTAALLPNLLHRPT